MFGLEAATGLIGWLSARGRGFADWGPCLPIVTGAILFDLVNGGDKDWGDGRPTATWPMPRPPPPAPDVTPGQCRRRLGAMAGPLKGGLGTASAFDASPGITVAALVAANPVGSVTMPGSGTMWAWHLEQAGELGGQPAADRCHRPCLRDQARHRHEHHDRGGGHRRRARPRRLQRLAAMAQDGYAYAIRPIHTPFDGDTVFALATGAVPLPDRPDALVRLGTIAADVVARAVMRGCVRGADLGRGPGLP